MSLPSCLKPLGLALLLTAPALAAPPRTLTPERLSAHADRVVRARVVAQHQEEGADRLGGLRTVSTLEVQEVLAGPPATELLLVQLGGSRGAERSGVVGDAKVQRGEEAVWFLRCRDPREPTRCTLVGHAAGRMPWNPRTRRVQVEPEGKGATLAIEALRLTVQQEMAR